MLDFPAVRMCDLWLFSVILEAVFYGTWLFATKENVMEGSEENERIKVPAD